MKKQREAIAEDLRALKFLPLKNIDAEVLAFLIGKSRVKQQEIEVSIGAGQPRILESLHRLMDAGLIERERKPQPGKGANPFVYSPSSNFFKELTERIADHRKEIRETEEDLWENISDLTKNKIDQIRYEAEED